MYQVAADRLLEFTDRHAEEIASEWWKNIRKNQKVPSYHSLNEKDILPHTIQFYKSLKQFYNSENAFEATASFAKKYTETSFKLGIPLQEIIFALVMMRRQMWIFAEFHALFINALDIHQATDSINRTVLLTDYATYSIVQRYLDLAKPA
jgi:hypothetical protein